MNVQNGPLNKFINFNRPARSASKNTVVVMDGHNLMFRCAFISHKQDILDENYTYWKYLMMNSILGTIRQFKPNRLIIANDSRNYWRKDLYPEYKAHRKGERDKAIINYDTFFPVANQFFADFKEVFKNIFLMQVDKCEADDIIAVLTNELIRDNIIAITTDKDMHQLMKNKHYHQYDPVKRKIAKSLNPVGDLEIKILTGDRGDNIPGVKPKCGPVTARKMLERGLDEIFDEDETIRENYKRNKQLIDFRMIPEHVITKIRKQYDEYEVLPYQNKGVFNFLVKHRLGNILSDMQMYLSPLKTLK